MTDAALDRRHAFRGYKFMKNTLKKPPYNTDDTMETMEIGKTYEMS